MLFGLGLDATDGHLRMTTGPNFNLMGGSEPTHERMQETCMRFNEKLKKIGATLDEIQIAEARRIMREIEQKI